MKRLLSLILLLAIFLTAFSMTPANAAANTAITSTETDSTLPSPWENTASPSLSTQTANPQTVSPASIALPFTDVSAGAWYYEDVRFVYENDIMKGISATSFSPNRTLTRGELVTVLYRLDGSPAVETTNAFVDVTSNHYYSKPVAWAEMMGIVCGVTPTEFRPGQHVTREQIATILYRYYTEYIGIGTQGFADLSGYTDATQISRFAREAMSWSIGVGLVKGVSTTELEPKGSSTRAQVASFMNRLNQLLQYGSIPEEPAVPVVPHSGTISEAGLEFIKSKEGFSATPFWDYMQYSIGYGTACPEPIPSHYWDGISEEEAEELLRNELAQHAEKYVKRFEERNGFTFTQSQFDALVSFTYNVGHAWMDGCMLTTWLNADQSQQTELQLVWSMGVWCRAGGVVETGLARRRLQEAYIFLYGDYTGTGGHPEYSYVRYKGNGGLLTTSRSDDIGYYTVGSPYGTLPTPIWNSSASTPTFAGWYTSSGREITNSTIVAENLTLTAHWN